MHSVSEENHSKRRLHMTIYKTRERTVEVNLEIQVVSGYAWCQIGFGRQITFFWGGNNERERESGASIRYILLSG